jgi:hydroxymethylpyrimidine pyrophosphatase-like HAD family hydrolase
MSSPLKLISTDFDGTLHGEYDRPAIPERFTSLIAEQQARGAKWVINTGRDMSSLMEALARERVPVLPDYLVLVEREIYKHDGGRYAPVEHWNTACAHDHAELYSRVRPQVAELMDWVNGRFRATVYEDVWSPFCLIAGTNADADQIHARLDEFCKPFPELAVVRNDVYARFSHVNYNKGTALAELSRMLGVTSDGVLAAGDHLNDLPMLKTEHAHYLVAPSNAIPLVKDVVRKQGGYVSELTCGNGVADGLEHCLKAVRQ